MNWQTRKIAIVFVAGLLNLCQAAAQARSSSQASAGTLTLEGTVRDPAGNLVPDATVLLENGGQPRPLETTTDAQGRFAFANLSPGLYTLRARKAGQADAIRDSIRLPFPEHKRLDVVMAASDRGKTGDVWSPETISLDDKTDFTVAGVTDWSAAGGHGSDAHLRASEALARDTRGLARGPAGEDTAAARMRNHSEENLRSALAREPASFALNHELGELYLRSHRAREAVPLLEAASQIDRGNYANDYDLALAYEGSGDLVRARDQVRKLLEQGERADLDRLAADLDEQMNDPLSAVRRYERAAALDPSEQNYFDWAAELLIHRAIQPAVEIFTKGSQAYPRSERMRAGLGAALYAGGAFDKAAEQLCAASDLSPRDSTPYLFLARMAESAPQPLACVEEKLARFATEEPENAPANYYYALALTKRLQASGDAAVAERIERLLQKTIRIEPRFAEAYVALGARLAEKGDLASAIAAYSKAVELNANLAEAHFRLGQAYKRTGETLKAQNEFAAYKRASQTEMAAVERQRRDVRQFVVVLKAQSPPP